MRRGAISSSRALAEQATVSEQVARLTEALTRQTASLSRAMHDQAGAAVQVAGEIDNIRKQAEQGERALADQARAMKELTGASLNTAKQIKLISAANREHSSVSGSLLAQLQEIRRITDENVRSARDTRGGTAELTRQASTLVGSLAARKVAPARSRTTNGRR